MNEIKQELTRLLGMTEKQTRVYLASLELGGGTMQSIARKSGLNRTTIYTFIDEMKEAGFMQETRSARRRIYTAVDPRTLLSVQKNKLSGLEHMLPELMAIRNEARGKPRVTFFEGRKGVEEVYEDMLHDRAEILSYEDMDNLKSGLAPSFFASFPKERVRRDIPLRSISCDTSFAREFSKRNRGLLRETRFVPLKELRTDISIYGDKVALMDLRGDPQTCVLIENRNIAESMRSIWTQLWHQLPPWSPHPAAGEKQASDDR